MKGNGKSAFHYSWEEIYSAESNYLEYFILLKRCNLKKKRKEVVHIPSFQD